MEYGITRMTIGCIAFSTISMNEYNVIKTAVRGLTELFYLEEKFDLLIANYLDFETTLLDTAAHWMIHQNLDYSWFQYQRSLLVRRVVNLLTACRLYLDQTTHHLSSIAGPDSLDVRAFKASCSREYEGRLGYRVMDAVRNFVQHRGYPVHGISYPSKRVSSASGHNFLFTVTPYMEPAYFREDSSFKKPVLRELQRLGSKVDIKPMVREYIESLGTIHNDVRALLKERTESWKETYLAAIRRFSDEYPAEPQVGVAAVERIEDGTVRGEVYLFHDLIEHIEYLGKINRSVQHLSRSYVTGRTITTDV